MPGYKKRKITDIRIQAIIAKAHLNAREIPFTCVAHFMNLFIYRSIGCTCAPHFKHCHVNIYLELHTQKHECASKMKSHFGHMDCSIFWILMQWTIIILQSSSIFISLWFVCGTNKRKNFHENETENWNKNNNKKYMSDERGIFDRFSIAIYNAYCSCAPLSIFACILI